jgi:hypothetical protein
MTAYGNISSSNDGGGMGMDPFEPRPIGPNITGNNMLNRGSMEGHARNYDKPVAAFETTMLPDIPSSSRNSMAYSGASKMPTNKASTSSSTTPSSRRKDFQRESSDRSIKSIDVDKVFPTMGGGGSGHSKTMDQSTISVMSLSIGEILDRVDGEDGGGGMKQLSGDMSADPDQLAPLFDSSLQLDSHTNPAEKRRSGSRRPPGRTGSGDGLLGILSAAKNMEMSAMSLGGFSEIGEGSVSRMTESNNGMSFTNVFDNSSDHL